jgi:hypothetical protein
MGKSSSSCESCMRIQTESRRSLPLCLPCVLEGCGSVEMLLQLTKLYEYFWFCWGGKGGCGSSERLSRTAKTVLESGLSPGLALLDIEHIEYLQDILYPRNINKSPHSRFTRARTLVLERKRCGNGISKGSSLLNLGKKERHICNFSADADLFSLRQPKN